MLKIKIMLKSIPIPIYDGMLHIHIGKPSDETMISLELAPLDKDNESYAQTHSLGKVILVWFNSKEINYGLIAHELIHTKNYLFKHIGYDIDTGNDELEAYFMEWLTNQTIIVFKEFGN